MTAAFFVQDACGERFLVTFAAPEHEPKFRKHARQWIAHATRPGAHADKDACGNRVRTPVKPCRIVMMTNEEFARI